MSNIHNMGGILAQEHLFTPDTLRKALPVNASCRKAIAKARQTIARIIHRQDPRFLIVCGPCSIHDPEAAVVYGKKLQHLANQIQDQIYLVMRVYFEKPRTSLGWKGFIHDPKRDHSDDMALGLQLARSLLSRLTQLNLPLATEALDPNILPYLNDFISWVAIGARTSESQIHREMASALNLSVGFKNSTDGNIDVAIHAMKTAAISHRFIGFNPSGNVCMFTSAGNKHTHLILRGGKQPNYSATAIAGIEQQLHAANMEPALMVDCSHCNCNKDYRKQITVARDVLHQILAGNNSIMGLMLESYLNPGAQSPYLPETELTYGVSVTDPCLGWDDSERLLLQLTQALRRRKTNP